MIQILTVKDEKQRKSLCEKAGIEYDLSLSIIATFDEKDQPEYGAIFRYIGEIGEILWIEMNDDFDLTLGLGKSILSIMELRGVKTVTMPLHYERLAKGLRFETKDEHFSVNLEGYFNCCCQHK
ncbi:MAG: hypothetical protein IJN42_03790 [Clostridia bacterium]|nr:hypothetical protein [Clostridia bacterium]